MKYLVLLAFLGVSSTPVLAQQKTNKQATAEMAALRTSGHFAYKIGENRHVNVNYSFAPVEPTTTVDFMLHTPNPRPLWFQITDAAGKVVVAEWKPEQPKYMYRDKLDVSTLKAGKYIYKIYWDKDVAYSIPFTKK